MSSLNIQLWYFTGLLDMFKPSAESGHLFLLKPQSFVFTELPSVSGKAHNG